MYMDKRIREFSSTAVFHYIQAPYNSINFCQDVKFYQVPSSSVKFHQVSYSSAKFCHSSIKLYQFTSCSVNFC